MGPRMSWFASGFVMSDAFFSRFFLVLCVITANIEATDRNNTWNGTHASQTESYWYLNQKNRHISVVMMTFGYTHKIGRILV